ncbi:ASCH domain-containing protein [Candidatus Woesearchaeota archaeon]|nr:ASCH domain-containing protein [Candidatus Woesearchaeota archaeon]
MKCLSLKQPWAELVVNGRKTIEIRKWNTKFRGDFIVHASKIPNAEAMTRLGFESLPVGCIVGKAKIVRVKMYSSIEEFEGDGDKHFAKCYDWNKKGKLYGFILENAQRLHKIPLKGQLNFFDVNDNLSRSCI